ncbi:hypothetical protein JW879_05585 [candidate division WOR-3 bacterium]|nr:hypothetical protein [candidate division WOR-3 bacterium]
MGDKKSSKSSDKRKPEAQELVLWLYRDYATRVSKNLWPWEKARWYELVFCILATIGEPEVMSATIRHLTTIMARLGLLELSSLAGLKFPGNPQKSESPILTTIDTLLQRVGFTPEKAKFALNIICTAASSIGKKYDGKVQNYLRKYGDHMLEHINEDFGIDGFDEAPRAIAIWLQNTLNMPVPASNPFADQACESLGVKYEELVKAAYKQDINVALLDDALRAYWGRRIKDKQGSNV